MKISPLHHDAFWISLGQSFYLGCQWLLAFAFARLGGANDVGTYAFGLAVCAPIIIFVNMHLRELHASDASGEFLFRERFALRLMGLGVGLSLILLLCAIMPWDTALISVVVAVALSKVVESIAEFGYGGLQRARRFRALAIEQIIRGLTGLACGVVTFVLTDKIWLALIALLAGWSLVVIFFDLSLLRRIITTENDSLVPSSSGPRLQSMLRQSVPMGLAGGLNTLTLMASCYVIQGWHDSAQLGYFVTTGYLLLPVNIAILALGQAAVPRFAAAHHSKDQRAILRLVSMLALIVSTIGGFTILGSWLIGDHILALVYGTEWSNLQPVLFYLALGGCLNWLATVSGFAVTAMRHLTYQAVIATVTSIVSIAMSLLLIPSQGLIGAAMANIITAATLFTGYAILFWRAYRRMNGTTT